MKGGGVDVDDKLGAGLPLHQGRAGLVPDVLTDVHADADVVQLVNGAHVALDEIALFVEDAVVGQEYLVVGVYEPAAESHRCRVCDTCLAGPNISQHHNHPVGGGHHLLHGFNVGINEGPLEKQVLGRIAGGGKLRKRDQIGTGLPGLLQVVQHPCRVAGEVSDREVDLCQREADSAGHLHALI